MLAEFNANRSLGFTIIEVLVTSLLLGLGLLGLARLQTESLRYTQVSEQRSQAARLAAELADRMRANPQGVERGGYDRNSNTEDAGCADKVCSPGEIADDDLAEWRMALQTRLPGDERVTGEACIDSTPNDGSPMSTECDALGEVYAIKIWWDDRRNGDLAQFQRFVTSLRP